MIDMVRRMIWTTQDDQRRADYVEWWGSPRVVEAHLSTIQAIARDAMAIM